MKKIQYKGAAYVQAVSKAGPRGKGKATPEFLVESFDSFFKGAPIAEKLEQALKSGKYSKALLEINNRILPLLTQMADQIRELQGK
jgi:hypothetical protein